MSTAVAIILTILTFAFVFYPFFRRKVRVTGTAGTDKLEELRSERDVTYSMLKELEFDYQSGILTEEDYKELEARYKRKAISTLRDIDMAARGGAEEELDEIEKQVQQLRKSRSGKTPGQTKAAAKQFCTQCGTEVNQEDKFCSNCGVKLGGGKAGV